MKRALVHIDRLVLKGFGHAKRHDLAEGLRTELARILSEPADCARFGVPRRLDVVNVGRVVVRRGATPSTIGAKAAQGIGKAMLS